MLQAPSILDPATRAADATDAPSDAADPCFAATCASYPERICVHVATANRSLTRSSRAAPAGRVAAGLQGAWAIGVGRDRVGHLPLNASLDMVVAMLGVVKSRRGRISPPRPRGNPLAPPCAKNRPPTPPLAAVLVEPGGGAGLASCLVKLDGKLDRRTYP